MQSAVTLYCIAQCSVVVLETDISKETQQFCITKGERVMRWLRRRLLTDINGAACKSLEGDPICNGCQTLTTSFDWQYWLVYEVVGSCGPAANSEPTACCCSSVVRS